MEWGKKNPTKYQNCPATSHLCLPFFSPDIQTSELLSIVLPTRVEGDHVGHQLVKGDVPIQLTSCCPAAALKKKKKANSSVSNIDG